jgi:hypothetical protein
MPGMQRKILQWIKMNTVMSDRASLVGSVHSDHGDEKLAVIPRPPIIDTGDDEIEILLRYDNVYRALVHARLRLTRTSEKGSLIGWCICFGFQGRLYFDELRSQLNFSMLRCALFIVAAMAAYVNPPDLGNIVINDIFMVATGFAAVAEMCAIIGYTLFSIMINRPYTLIDTMVARVRNHLIFVIGTIFDSAGMLSLLGALLIARTHASGSLAPPLAVMWFLMLLSMWIWSLVYTDEVQTKRIKIFTNTYLNLATGQLVDSVLAAIYRPADLSAFLAGVGQSHHLDKFVGFDLEAVLLMDKSDLVDLFHTSAQLTRRGDESAPEERTARLLLLTEIRIIYEEIQRVKKLHVRS